MVDSFPSTLVSRKIPHHTISFSAAWLHSAHRKECYLVFRARNPVDIFILYKEGTVHPLLYPSSKSQVQNFQLEFSMGDVTSALTQEYP